jgi:ketosteroid isomerase-like protein
MRTLRNALMLSVVAFSMPAFAAGDDPFNALNRKFEQTVSSQDAKGWASLYASNAILVPVGEPVVVGHDNILKWGEEAVKVWNKLSINEGPAVVKGDVAWQPSTWTGNINTPDGKKMDISGRGLVVLQKEGTDWKIVADTFSFDPPPSSATGSSTAPK